jgi:hypothetical protein
LKLSVVFLILPFSLVLSCINQPGNTAAMQAAADTVKRPPGMSMSPGELGFLNKENGNIYIIVSECYLVLIHPEDRQKPEE